MEGPDLSIVISIVIVEGDSVGPRHHRDPDGDGEHDEAGVDKLLTTTKSIVSGIMKASPCAINIVGNMVEREEMSIAYLLISHAASENENVKVFHVIREIVVVNTYDVAETVVEGVIAAALNGMHKHLIMSESVLGAIACSALDNFEEATPDV